MQEADWGMFISDKTVKQVNPSIDIKHRVNRRQDKTTSGVKGRTINKFKLDNDKEQTHIGYKYQVEKWLREMQKPFGMCDEK